jgi:hypothetical protein|tara:strand:- start:195 stop:620 length:426 start_codon:yes stop_codon:yes gene_type:complete
MVYIPLKNGSGQVVKDIKLKSPDGKSYTVVRNKRKGINRYEIELKGSDGSTKKVMNHDIMKKKSDPDHEPWEVVGGFHSPAKLAKMFDKKVDPDSNKPRPQRKSFWKQDNKPGTHSHSQKQRLMKKEEFKKFREYFKNDRD